MPSALTNISLRLFATLLFALLCPAAPGFAQTGQVSSVVREAFAVRAFDDIDLPQASVRAVHVCEQGYLWAGTRAGLVQYKSGQQRTWTQTEDGQTGLPSGMVNTIYEDDRGNIWVGTGRGIAIKAEGDDTFRVLIQSDESRAEQLDIVAFELIGGTLYAVSTSGEVLSVSENGAELLSLRTDYVKENHSDLRDLRPTSATADGADLLVGTTGSSIYRLRIEGAQFDLLEVIGTASAVVDIQRTDSQLIWLERDTGLAWLDLDGNRTQSRIDPLAAQTQSYYRAVAARSSRSAWFGAGPSIVRVRGNRADVVRLPGRGNEVRSITFDRAGNIWIGTYYGLYYGLDTDFNTLKTAASYESGVISSLAETGGRLFVGGQNLWTGNPDNAEFTELKSQYDPSKISDLRLNPLSVGQDPITALATGEDLLLVGYFVGGLDVIDLETGSVANVTEDQATGESLENVGVSGFVRVADNTWLATLYLYGLVEISVTRRPGAAPQVSLRKLSDLGALIGVYRITESRYLAVDQSGLHIVDASHDDVFTVTPFDTAPLGLVFAVEADGQGGVFLGIENTGVRHLSAASLDTAAFSAEPLPIVESYLARRTIWHLMLEDEDTLWATTNNGVYVFDLPREKLVSHITYRDGLPSNEFEYGPSASLLTQGGEKIFISNRGPVTFKAPVQPRDKQIALTWTDIRVDDESVGETTIGKVDAASVLSLPFDAVHTSLLRLEYGYDDHIKALDATYASRFDTDGDWIPGALPSMSLTGIQSWDPIHLEIAMLNTSGAVISDTLSIDITLSPPAYMLSFIDLRIAVPLLALISLLLLVTQRRARRRQQEALAQAARQREIVEAEMRGRLSEKEILLREIHHRVGNILSNFSANVSGMRRNARSDETRSALGQLSARIKVQSAVHSLLQRSDNTDINVANMIRQVVSGARDLMGSVEDQSVSLMLDDIYMTYSKAQYVGLITNELLTNTYKHGRTWSQPTLASISMHQSADGTVLYSYRDFGPGISPDALSRVLATGPREVKGGFAQVIAMITELKAKPLIENEQGLHVSFCLPARLVSSPRPRDPDDLETPLAD